MGLHVTCCTYEKKNSCKEPTSNGHWVHLINRCLFSKGLIFKGAEAVNRQREQLKNTFITIFLGPDHAENMHFSEKYSSGFCTTASKIQKNVQSRDSAGFLNWDRTVRDNWLRSISLLLHVSSVSCADRKWFNNMLFDPECCIDLWINTCS